MKSILPQRYAKDNQNHIKYMCFDFGKAIAFLRNILFIFSLRNFAPFAVQKKGAV